jgi:IMP dehydrogenase
MMRVLCFDDVLLTPQFSSIESRKNVDLTPYDHDSLEPVRLSPGSKPLTSPVVGAPMDTVVGPTAAGVLSACGGFGVLHRYCTIDEAVKSFEDAETTNVMCAIGATGDFMERAEALYAAGCRAFCVDVAHGHHANVMAAAKKLREAYRKGEVHLMGGNVATLEGFNDLAGWGFDSIRVGVGGGSVCTTRIQTGHGIPTLASIFECAKSDRDVLIVADGGIRNSGDGVKALAAGADLIMLGSVLSGHIQSPGRTIEKDGKRFKEFRGMASKEAQLDWRGRVGGEEGVSLLVPFKGDLINTVESFHDGLRSGLSYSGATKTTQLRSRAKFVTVTSNSVHENHPHASRL